MLLWPTLRRSSAGGKDRRVWFCLCVGLTFLATALGFSLRGQAPEHAPPKAAFLPALAPIYSNDLKDPWNHIFYFLFSRHIETRLSNEFADGAPFSEQPLFHDFLQQIHTSIGVFGRDEVGDRAIDPLYPEYPPANASKVILADPAYVELTQALQEALSESAPRTGVARLLMQSDLWGAYDLLSFARFNRPEEKEIEDHRLRVLDLLGRLISKIALTSDEIRSLPDNYSTAAMKHSLPAVFQNGSGWVEIQWLPDRLHDRAAGYRRFVRVFLKPLHVPQDMKKFLNAERDSFNAPADLDGLALVTQIMAIDAHGKLQPTTLTSEVQVRLFERTSAGVFKKTNLQVAEISRRLILRDPESGGLVKEDEAAPNYLPSAGNDYGFASVQDRVGSPVQVRLRTRCSFCHGDDLTTVMTFSFIRAPGRPVEPVRQFDPKGHQAAQFGVAQKEKQAEFRELRAYFRGH